MLIEYSAQNYQMMLRYGYSCYFIVNVVNPIQTGSQFNFKYNRDRNKFEKVPIPNNKVVSVMETLNVFDLMAYPIYRCKQIITNLYTSKVICNCPAEISSGKFNLVFSRVYAFVNVKHQRRCYTTHCNFFGNAIIFVASRN